MPTGNSNPVFDYRALRLLYGNNARGTYYNLSTTRRKVNNKI